MVVHLGLGQERRVVPDDPGERAEVLRDLRVALVGHGNTADGPADKPFTHLTQFRTLQVIDFMADFIKCRRDHR